MQLGAPIGVTGVSRCARLESPDPEFAEFILMDLLTTIEAAQGKTHAEETPDSTRPVSSRQVAIGAIALALAGALGWAALVHQPARAALPPLATLGVAAPLVAPVVEWDNYVGRFAPSQTVDVRPRAAGQVTALLDVD